MKNEREQELISRLSIVQKLSLAEAMELLGISESTARRMFSKLEADGVAIRTHGGIQAARKTAMWSSAIPVRPSSACARS